MFWDPGGKVSKSQDLFNTMGCMYATVLFLGTQNSSSVQPVVAVERTVFYRERVAGMYSALPYAFGQSFVFMQAVFCGAIMYAMIGFERTVTKFFWYLFVLFFTLLYFTFYGMMTVVVTPNVSVAQIISFFFKAYGILSQDSSFHDKKTVYCHMVEMVLLVLSLDLVWFDCIIIWRSAE